MKKIVIVEDKPWITKEAVENLQNRANTQVLSVIYYPNKFGDAEEKERLISDFENATGLQVEKVYDQDGFVKKMEELYSMEDVVFFMDYDLKGDYTKEPEERINVRYAWYKEYGEDTLSKARKMWFYTATGHTNVELITRFFPERVLQTASYENGQLKWNQDALDRVLE